MILFCRLYVQFKKTVLYPLFSVYFYKKEDNKHNESRHIT